MTRILKFRMFGIPEDVYMDILYPHGDEEKMLSVMIPAEDLVFEEHSPLHELLRDNDSKKIMQYTGLKDTRGKEIYESDIVADQELAPESQDVLYGLVFWEETAARFAVQWYWPHSNTKRNPPVSLQSQARDVYVIGNIYENANFLPNLDRKDEKRRER